MIDSARIPVALVRCRGYAPDQLMDRIDQVCQGAGFAVRPGSVILLKPNLVSAGSGPSHLACTSPELVRAVAEWALAHGARVLVGDSPAFGSARLVMRACGMLKALGGLPVEVADFDRAVPVVLPCGLKIPVARAALECDVLLNLPRVKAHGQLYVSLAVKNYFGVVVGWRKALHHARHGDIGNRFEALLVDLPSLFPASFSLIDGIVAMQRTGPMKGEPYSLGLLGAAHNPVALDAALLEIIGAEAARSPLWRECLRRALPGTDSGAIVYTRASPGELLVRDFQLPEILSPVTFHPGRMMIGGCRRLVARIFPE